jgi:hypothetical protein
MPIGRPGPQDGSAATTAPEGPVAPVGPWGPVARSVRRRRVGTRERRLSIGGVSGPPENGVARNIPPRPARYLQREVYVSSSRPPHDGELFECTLTTLVAGGRDFYWTLVQRRRSNRQASSPERSWTRSIDVFTRRRSMRLNSKVRRSGRSRRRHLALVSACILVPVDDGRAETAVIERARGRDAIATMIVDGKRGDNMRYILAVLLGVLCSVSPGRGAGLHRHRAPA